MFVADSFLGDLIAVFITSIFITFYYNWFYQYWQRRKVPCLQSQFSSSKEHLGIKFKKVYDTIKKEHWKHAGVFMQLSPIYIPGDLELLKNIMTKDFEYFPHRGLYYNEKCDPLSCHIFNTSGEKWKRMRSKLNQIFTPGRLKTMFFILEKCEENLMATMELLVKKQEPVDVKKVADGFVSGVIESCVFGLDCQNFEERSLFEEFGRRIFKRSRVRRIKGFVVENFPKLGEFLNIALIPKDASSFFLKIVEDAVAFRKNNNIVRHDFLQVLTDGNLSVEEIAAQCFIFFLAGMSTSPTAISFAMYELAKNEEIQNRVRQEIGAMVKKFGKITFEAIQEMKYLDQVFDETLRKYPPAAYLNRKCVKNYKVLDSDVVIEKGTTLVIPILGLHHDEDFYPNPEKFYPERFSEENKRSRPSYAFIPFGEGPRICIAMRFGLLQSKLALISLIKNYKFTVNNKTQEPLKMKANTLVLTPDSGIWLDFKTV